MTQVYCVCKFGYLVYAWGMLCIGVETRGGHGVLLYTLCLLPLRQGFSLNLELAAFS